MPDIRNLIKTLGLTMQQVADKCGISRRSLHRWLSAYDPVRHEKIMEAINQLEGGEEA